MSKTEEMVEVRFHGRGGQGVVLAATLAAEVAFRCGYYPQAFPFFGAERRGAPVMAFLRYSKNPLMPRSRIYYPFCAVAFDAELPRQMVLEGLQEKGVLLLNASKGYLASESFTSWLKEAKGREIYAVDASHLAAEYGLIASGMPLVSSIMVGALVKILGLALAEELKNSLKGKIPQREKENIAGALRGFQEVKEVLDGVPVK